MKTTLFNPRGALIVVSAFVWGPLRERERLRLILDTGCADTAIDPGILDLLGYNPRQGETVTTVRSVVGKEQGYFIRVGRFRALGHEVRDFRINALDMPEGYGFDGLLGLNFLRQLNYEIRSGEGRILAERAAMD